MSDTELSLSEETKLVVAMKNANAIAETLVHHGKCMEELDVRLQTLSNHVQILYNKMATLESLYHQSLSQKYGNGPTSL